MGIPTGQVQRGDGRTPAIALIDPKFPHNVGAAVRAASCYGVRQVWFTGDRVRLIGERHFRLPREERMRGYQEVELRHADRPFEVCHRFVVIPTRHCTNLSAAVYTVLYDRHAKRVAAGLEHTDTVTGRDFEKPDHMADAIGVQCSW